jgi:enoyl-CoA hydratase/carnithine racemase
MNLQTDKMQARKDGGIGWLIFNNPERRNAVSLEMWQAIAIILEDFAKDDAVRVVVMRGTGDKAFVAGADISQFEANRADAAAAAAYGEISKAGWRALRGVEKPLLAMIRGYCIGGGLAIAMQADVRIAAADSQFGIPAAKLGIAYGYEGVKNLVDLVGPAQAKSILFTGRFMKADEALRIGLVNEVVTVEALEATVQDYAATLIANAPLSIKASKLTVEQILRGDGRRDQALIDKLQADCFNSADYAEGRRAFMAKRKPVFNGR